LHELRDIEKYLKREILQSYSNDIAEKKLSRDEESKYIHADDLYQQQCD